MSSPFPADAPMTAEQVTEMVAYARKNIAENFGLPSSSLRLLGDALLASETARAAAEAENAKWHAYVAKVNPPFDIGDDISVELASQLYAAEAQAARLREALERLWSIVRYSREDASEIYERIKRELAAILTPPSQEGDGHG